MVDFRQLGHLMDLARDIDMDGLVELAEKVDLPELIRVVRRLNDEQLRYFEQRVREVVEADRVEDANSGADQGSAHWQHPPIRKAAVLGAGTMGAQIAAHLANAGVDVLLLDIPGEGHDRNAPAQKGFERARSRRPDPFFDEDSARRIEIGNFDDDFERISEADWVVEAVVENLKIKRSITERIERHASKTAVVSTNTSGIPITSIVEGRDPAFQRRFLGTHFFNPPRYLHLLEVIPTDMTAPEVVDRMVDFGRVHLGKGVVTANDVPYFIGNRIGVYGMLQAIRMFTDGDYSIEEIDMLTGPLVGRPKSATFRTADVVGLDVLLAVADNLYQYEREEESREVFDAPQLLRSLVDAGSLGAKSKRGFYKKEGRSILSVDRSSMQYVEPAESDLSDVQALSRLPLKDRLNKLYEDQGRAGRFFRTTMLDFLAYAARRVPEVSDRPSDVDRAIRWGFGWELGPFQIWDTLGFERVLADIRSAGHAVPKWIEELSDRNHPGFYRIDDDGLRTYRPSAKSFSVETRSLLQRARTAAPPLWSNDDAALIDVGDGVAVFEFRTRGNVLSTKLMHGLEEAIDFVVANANLRGLVIGNDGKNFSVGANLHEVMTAIDGGDFGSLEKYVGRFQEVILRVRYAAKPVIVAVHQRVLGGGCELLMACHNAVAAAESYIGLVELGVGLIPGGTGSTHLAAQASDSSPSGHPSEIQAALQVLFQNVATARVSESAHAAQKLGYLSRCAGIVMNEHRVLDVAKQRLIQLSEEGYRPPAPRTAIKVLGKPARAAFEVHLQQYLEGNFISEYDRRLGSDLAHVITGGEISGPQEVSEDYMLDLERSTILRLLGEKKTQDRIRYMLENGKPLRN